MADLLNKKDAEFAVMIYRSALKGCGDGTIRPTMGCSISNMLLGICA
jgi:hypothetical protein